MMNINNITKMFYATLFIIAPVLSYKTTVLFNLTMPVGMLFVTLIMLGLLDVMNYRMGMKETRKMILEALLVKVMIYLVIVPIAIALPSAPFFQEQETYFKILHESIRYFVVGEVISFLGNYFIDVRVFYAFRKQNWFVRVILSDIVSQMFLTVGFMILSFYGTGKPLMTMIFSSYLFRIGLSVIKSVVMYPLAKTRH